MNDKVLETIGAIIGCSVEDLRKVTEDTTLVEIGFTSQNYLICLFSIEEIIHRTFDDENSLFMKVKTWGDLKNLIQKTVFNA